MEGVDVEEEVLPVEVGVVQTAAVERVGLGGGVGAWAAWAVGLVSGNGPAGREGVGFVRRWESGGGRGGDVVKLRRKTRYQISTPPPHDRN